MTDEVRVVEDMWTWPGTAMTGQVSTEIAAMLKAYAETLPSMEDLRAQRSKGLIGNKEFIVLMGRRERVLRRAEQLTACWIK